MPTTEIWAHRGASAEEPENTLPAFARAVAAGVEGVEFDVQLTADDVPVVIHDEKIDRTHVGPGWVKDLTLDDIQSRPCRAPRATPDHRIPTLDAVLGVLAPAGVTINIELKNSEVGYAGLEQQVVDAITKWGIGDRVVLSSFNHYSLKKLQAMGAPGTLGVIYSDPLFKPWRYVKKLQMDAVHPPMRLLFGRRQVQRSHEAGLAVRPWVVNGRRDVTRMISWGVDAIFTDDPAGALAVRTELAGRSAAASSRPQT